MRSFPQTCCWILLVILLASGLQGAGSNRRNIVLIVVDDLGWTGLGCYGSDLHETPRIDTFARRSLRFTSAYSAAPVCSPTRASIQTGKSPARLNMTVWHEAAGEPPEWMRQKLIPPVTRANLPLSENTLAKELKKAGYFTAHVGKWHLGDAAHYPENQGFDVNIGGTFWGCPATFFYPYRGLFGSARELRYVPGLAFGKKGEYLTDRLTDEALKLIDRIGDRPFYLNLCYYTVHTPIEGKRELVEYYRKKLRPGLDHDNEHYAAMHGTLDENVGRLLDHLKRRGIADRTAILFISDNGGYVNEYRSRRVTSNRPLRSGKGSLYEGGIRVPFIVRVPGVTRPGSVCNEPVVTTDLYPTILQIAGVPGAPSGDVEGISILPLLREPGATLSRDALFFHYPHYYPTTSPVSAVRCGDWKLLEYHEDGRLELYNLAADLPESRNLAGERPGKSEELKRKLHAWRERVGAKMPRPNPDR